MQGWKIDKSKLTLKIYKKNNFRLIFGLSSELRDISLVIEYFSLACTRPLVQTKGSLTSNKSVLLCLDRQESHVQSWNGSESPKWGENPLPVETPFCFGGEIQVYGSNWEMFWRWDTGCMEAVGKAGCLCHWLRPLLFQLYNYFEDNNYVYLVLEMCHNGEMNRYLKNRMKPFSESEGRCLLWDEVVFPLFFFLFGKHLTFEGVLKKCAILWYLVKKNVLCFWDKDYYVALAVLELNI